MCILTSAAARRTFQEITTLLVMTDIGKNIIHILTGRSRIMNYRCIIFRVGQSCQVQNAIATLDSVQGLLILQKVGLNKRENFVRVDCRIDGR